MKSGLTTHTICLLGLVLLSGCASSFQSGDLRNVDDYPDVLTRKSIYVDLVFSGKLNGESWPEHDLENQEYIKGRLIEELDESGMFSTVSDGLKSTELQLHVAVINEKEKSSSNMTLSALTLFLYPNTEKDTFRLMASVKDPDTGKKETISLAGGVKRRQQLFLGLMAPFKPHSKELEKSIDRLVENLVLEIRRTGMVK